MINFDCNPEYQGPAQLRRFFILHQKGAKYRDIFPAGGKGTKGAVADYANWACNKAVAIECRSRGDIQGAQIYEGICDRIHARLPSFAKW